MEFLILSGIVLIVSFDADRVQERLNGVDVGTYKETVLPRVLVVGDLVVHIAGCASTDEANTTLVVIFDSVRRGYERMSTPQGFRKRLQPSKTRLVPFALEVNGVRCLLKWLKHSCRADCGPGVSVPASAGEPLAPAKPVLTACRTPAHAPMTQQSTQSTMLATLGAMIGSANVPPILPAPTREILFRAMI